MKPSQAGNPSRARSMAGARIAARSSRPWRRWASPHERTAPGTVIVRGPPRGSAVRPRARRASASAAAGARPDPLSADWCCAGSSQMSQKASPPMPQPLGMTTPSAAFVAIAASTALPPARRIERPAAVARWWGATTAPWEPRASGTGVHGCPFVMSSLRSRRDQRIRRPSRARRHRAGAPPCEGATAGPGRRRAVRPSR